MEQMAMEHNPQQSVFIHHADSKRKTLISGISWEDENVNELIDFLKTQSVNAKKTSPKRAANHLLEARIHAIQYRVDQTEQPTKHVTDQRAQKEYIERMKIIISGLSSSMLSENEQKIFGNLPTIKAVSKLVAASKQSPINDAILSDVINNFHEFNSISESTSRKIAVIHSCSRLDPEQKMNIISDIDDALSMLDSLYSNLNSINSDEKVAISIKTELFTQITASKELSDIDKAINHKLKGSIKNYVSLDFLKYRCDNLVQTVSAQKTVSDQNSNNVIDEESSKIVLEGIQDIIEKTQFKTGLLGGDTIRFKDDSSGKTKKKMSFLKICGLSMIQFALHNKNNKNNKIRQ